VLVKKFKSKIGTVNEEVFYDKVFEVFVIYFNDNENLMILKTQQD